MREAGIHGLYRRRRRGCTVRDLQAEPYLDLVDRDFVVEGPDEIWCTDITEHPTREGRCTALRSSTCSLAESSAGRSATTCAPNLSSTRSEWQVPDETPIRQATILHSDHGSQFTSWAFVRRLVDAGIVPSMGSIGDCYDNSLVESFWARCSWSFSTSESGELAPSLPRRSFEWIECWYNPFRHRNAIPSRLRSGPRSVPPRPLTSHRRCPA